MKILFLLCFFLTLAASHAQTVNVFGKDYSMGNTQVEDATLSFNEVASYLPKDLEIPQGNPEDTKSTLRRLERLILTQKKIYDREVERIAQATGKNDLTVAALFQSGQGEALSPTGQKAHNTYLALLYVKNQVKEGIAK